MGNKIKQTAQKSVQTANKDSKQFFQMARNTITDRFTAFQNTFNSPIGKLQKIPGKLVLSVSKQIFFQISSDNSPVQSAIDTIVGMFSGGNVAKSIGSLMKTAFRALFASFAMGYNERQGYLIAMNQMGGIYRIDYLFIHQRFSAQGLVKITKDINGSYVLVSSIDKLKLKDQVNVFQILVNRQFPDLPLVSKYKLLKLAKANNISQIDKKDITTISQAIELQKDIIQKFQKDQKAKKGITMNSLESQSMPFLSSSGEEYKSLSQYLKIACSKKLTRQNLDSDIILIKQRKNLLKYRIKKDSNSHQYNITFSWMIQTPSLLDYSRQSKLVKLNSKDSVLNDLWPSIQAKLYYQLYGANYLDKNNNRFTLEQARANLSLQGWFNSVPMPALQLQNGEVDTIFLKQRIVLKVFVRSDAAYYFPQIVLIARKNESKSKLEKSAKITESAKFTATILGKLMKHSFNGSQPKKQFVQLASTIFTFKNQNFFDVELHNVEISDLQEEEINIFQKKEANNKNKDQKFVTINITDDDLIYEIWENYIESEIKYEAGQTQGFQFPDFSIPKTFSFISVQLTQNLNQQGCLVCIQFKANYDEQKSIYKQAILNFKRK